MSVPTIIRETYNIVVNKIKYRCFALVGTTDKKGNDAGNVVTEPFSQSHNRFIEDVAETQLLLGHMTWAAAEEVTAVRFKLMPGAGGTPPTVGDIVRVVFDASPIDDTTNDTQAWAWLAAAGGAEATDVEYNELSYIPKASLVGADDGWSEWFEFGGILRRADFLYVNGSGITTNMDILAETA